jgi:uncharacterized protein (TIGR01777 family)
MKIVIPGGSGQVGTLLARAFHADGHEVIVLSRGMRAVPWKSVVWDGETIGHWADEVDGADVVINLAGRSVNCRYQARNRREIMNSRVFSTRAVGEAIAQARRPPPLWLQASTATIYAHRYDVDNDESAGQLGGDEPDAPDTWRFSIEVAKAWERTFDQAVTPATRKVALRSAMTMSPDAGGVFATLSTLVRCGLGGPVGNGRQFVSWIHEQDFIRAIYWLIEHQAMSGVINLAAPNPLPYADFMRDLRVACGVPVGLPAPSWLLEIGTWLLRTESELVLKSRRVVPGRLLASGFEFRFPEWPGAARELSQHLRRAKPKQSGGLQSSLLGLTM